VLQGSSCLGLGTVVQHTDGNGVALSYIQQSGDSSAITTGPQYAGDQVTGLDRFGQVIDQNWVNTSTPTPTTTDRFQQNYDQDGDVLYSNNLLNPSESELFHSSNTTAGDDNSAYDPLQRLTAFERGTLSASGHNGGVLDTVSSPNTTQSWNLDAVGNQASVTANGTTVSNTTNAKNMESRRATARRVEGVRSWRLANHRAIPMRRNKCSTRYAEDQQRRESHHFERRALAAFGNNPSVSSVAPTTIIEIHGLLSASSSGSFTVCVTPSFLSTDSGGPSNRVSGTLPT
jgi:hypothetical protein